MIFFVLILLLIMFGSAECSKPNEFNRDYISRDGIAPIKGIFVILILFSHGKGYLNLSGTYDDLYMGVQGHLGQMVVAMFLFYSGYGIMEQMKKKGFDYVMTIPKKRFPHLLMIFDIAVVLYMILYVALGNHLSVPLALQALIGWQGVYNSSWYIFITFALYLITFVAFFAIRWIKNKRLYIINILLVTVLSAAMIIAFWKLSNKEGFWYNTAILYVLGMWYSYFKDTVEAVVMKNDITYFGAMSIALLAYIFFYFNKGKNFAFYELWAMLFTLGIVLITMKIKLNSRILTWFGDHIFSIYILQRIPMVLLKEFGFADRHKYAFMIVSIMLTVCIAAIFDVLTGKLTNIIWKPKKIEN